MVMKRLNDTGTILFEKAPEGKIPDTLDRKVRLVYCGKFESMDGPVTIERKHLDHLVKKHNGLTSKLKRLAMGKDVPIGGYPPIQLDHTRSALVTVGRLIGDLSIEEFEIDEGVKVDALYSTMRVLGRENVEKVLDGRWATTSIGADLDEGYVSELSFTPFPAAKHSTVMHRLSTTAYKDDHGGTHEITIELDTVTGKYTASVDGKKLPNEYLTLDTAQLEAQKVANEKEVEKASLTDKDHAMNLKLMEKRLRRYWKLKKKLSDEQVDSELKKLEEKKDEEELKKLSDEMDDADEEDDEEKKKKKEEKLSAAKGKITTLSGSFKTSFESTRLAARSANIHQRLSTFRAQGKITPAEIKGMNVKDLAGKSDEAIDTLMASFQNRQPVIFVGQVGSMTGLTHAELAKKAALVPGTEMTLMELQARRDMNKISEEEYKKLSASVENKGESHVHLGSPEQDLGALEADFKSTVALMDAGDVTGAKTKLTTFFGRLQKHGVYGLAEATMQEDSSARLAEVQKQLAELQSKFDEAVALAESLAAGS